jgi:hypothetical protein
MLLPMTMFPIKATADAYWLKDGLPGLSTQKRRASMISTVATLGRRFSVAFRSAEAHLQVMRASGLGSQCPITLS